MSSVYIVAFCSVYIFLVDVLWERTAMSTVVKGAAEIGELSGSAASS